MALLALAVTAWARAGVAQGASTNGTEAVFRRAQRLANDGNMAAARAIVDSVMSASRDGSAAYVDALFWHATLAESADQARRDYLRLAVEFSLSPRAGEALIRLAQLELAGGNRAGAKKYLERLALEHPDEPSRAQGAYWLGRVLLEEGSMVAACTSLADARTHVASSDVELSNQIGYYARQCAGVQRQTDSAQAGSRNRVDPGANSESVARRPDTTTHTEGRDKPPVMSSALAWSAQVAAYPEKHDAERLARRLTARGYDARVTREPPFRVRIGHFGKRADAVALAQRLKNARIVAFVVEAERP